jgi:hypothetical protein
MLLFRKPLLKKLVAQLKALKVMLEYFDSSGSTKQGELKCKLNVEHARSLLWFSCPGVECMCGDFDLSRALENDPHFLDNDESVELKQYLHHLCEDLSGLLFQEGTGYAIVVEGAELEIPTASAIPLGFIVNELITNSAKYAEGHVSVRIEAMSPTDRSLSVGDDGPGWPAWPPCPRPLKGQLSSQAASGCGWRNPCVLATFRPASVW